ncbi:MAG: universal stress protein [Bdellovibrio sp.]|nr:universal stress protein [Bdellovibrio sp.]
MAVNKVLVADDFSDDSKNGFLRSTLLQDLGAETARRLKANMSLLYAVDIPKKYFNQKEIIMGPDPKRLARLPIKTEVEIVNGRPVESILKRDKQDSALELIILGTRGHRGVKKAILGSVSEEVLRNAQHPVMVLGPQALDEKYKLPASRKLKILVVTDLTEASEAAERFALKLAKQLPADVVIAHSVGDTIRRLKDMVYTQRIVNPQLDRIFDEIKLTAEESMARKVKAFSAQKIKVEPYLSYDEREVTKDLKDESWKHCDLIVMGTHSRNRILKAFLGSTARRTILSATIPVVIVRS